MHVNFFSIKSRFFDKNSNDPYSQNNNYFHSKRQPRTILSENSSHFVNLLIFAGSSFFLSKQPKNRGHVEDHSTVEDGQKIIETFWVNTK